MAAVCSARSVVGLPDGSVDPRPAEARHDLPPGLEPDPQRNCLAERPAAADPDPRGTLDVCSGHPDGRCDRTGGCGDCRARPCGHDRRPASAARTHARPRARSDARTDRPGGIPRGLCHHGSCARACRVGFRPPASGRERSGDDRCGDDRDARCSRAADRDGAPGNDRPDGTRGSRWRSTPRPEPSPAGSRRPRYHPRRGRRIPPP